MSDHIHTCSLYCDRPECMKRQRDLLRDALEQSEARVRELEAERAEVARRINALRGRLVEDKFLREIEG